MANRSNMQFVASVIALCVVACGGSVPQPASSEAPPAPSSGEASAARPALTAEACESNGGSVVGDIGDGATRRAEYRCANGAQPTGNIRAPEGGPIAIEGSVCCPR